ncbi:MAG: DUF885 domain-containing protein [Planctomycetales bacterium]|nr:DUF885 domain-containing protein [Planctomycetales bacterium]
MALLCLPWGVPDVSANEAASEQFAKLLDEMWEFELRESPLFATSVGDHRFDDRLKSVSLADSERRNKAQEAFLQRLEAIDREQLEPDDRMNHDIMSRQLRDDLAEHRFGSHLTPVTQRSGFHISFPELPQDVPLHTAAEHENYIARLRAFGSYADGHMELMRAGIGAELVLPAVVLEGWEATVDAQIVDDPTESLFYKPFLKFPATVAANEHARLRKEASEAIAGVIVPTYQRFRRFMSEEYVPRARSSIGASALPGGRDFYRHRVRKYTTLDTTPEEVHQIGLAEVKRIRGEMDEIIRRVEFDGDFAAFTTFLREDPQFYAKTSEELLKEVAFVLKTMDGQLPTLFGSLPRMTYGVREVPAYVAPRSTAAYYERPSGDGTKAGFFFMNTYNLSSRPLYTVAALSLHEAVPGHHLQIALQQELEDLPNFRRYSGFTAFVEGWALYAERLGLEVGIYDDPYSDFGRLTMEVWRAGRLVVDTGIHYFGWTRQQAIDFLTDNSAMSAHNIRAEVDRYISWPGQALAYKTGEMKIRELRALAEKQLGENFDIREFHDVVLRSGGIPLDVLEANVKAWLETK